MMTRVLLLISLTFSLSAAHAQSAWQAPAKASAKQNPLAAKPELAAGGARLFERSCASCHGSEASRRDKKAPDLSSASVQQEPDGALFWKISTGNSAGGMPSFSSLPEGQRWQLVLYIRSMVKSHD
jgi:mono/diheme cytochrome c family protein